MITKSPRRFFLGHHKCATQYIRRICHKMCEKIGLSAEITNNMKDPFEVYCQSNVDFHIVLNAKYKFQNPSFSDFLAFHVVRDPRDIIISAYYSHLHSHPTTQWTALKAQRKNLQKLNLDEGLISTMQFLMPTLNDLKRWERWHLSILELRFEDLLENPQTFFRKAFYHLKMIDSAEESKFLDHLVSQNNFENLSKGRNHGEEDVTSHYRKGIAGDWKNHFKPQHRDFFKAHFQEILTKFDYEVDDNW